MSDDASVPAELRSLQGQVVRLLLGIFIGLTAVIATVIGLASTIDVVGQLERRADVVARSLRTLDVSAAARLEDARLLEEQLSWVRDLGDELVSVVVVRRDGRPLLGIARSGVLDGSELEGVVTGAIGRLEVRAELPLEERRDADPLPGDGDLFDAIAAESGSDNTLQHEGVPRVVVTLSALPRVRDTLTSLLLTSVLLCLATLVALRYIARGAFENLRPAFDAARQMSAGDFTGRHVGEYRELAVLFDAFAEIGRSLSSMIDDARRVGTGVAEAVRLIREETEKLVEDAQRDQRSVSMAESAIAAMDASTRDTESTLWALVERVQKSSADATAIGVAMESSADALRTLLTEVEKLTGSVRALTNQADRFATSAALLDAKSGSARGSAERLKDALADIKGRVEDAAKLSDAALTGTQQGSTAVEAAMARVHQLADVVESFGAHVRGLISRVEAVTPMIGAIADVTSQTEMLALNAGILAAQAGEEGRGFQVVVDELKALARRTASLTGNVEDAVRSVLDERGRTIEATDRLRAIVDDSLIETGRATTSLAGIRESSLAAQEISSSLAGIVRSRVQDADGALVDLAELASAGRTVGETSRDLVREASVLAEVARRLETMTAGVAETAGAQGTVTRRVSATLHEVAQLVDAVVQRQRAERADSARVTSAMSEIRRSSEGAEIRAETFQDVVARLESETRGLEGALARFRTVR